MAIRLMRDVCVCLMPLMRAPGMSRAMCGWVLVSRGQYGTEVPCEHMRCWEVLTRGW